jgi:hypothetical protein
MKKETLGERVAKYAIIGYVALVTGVSGYIGGRGLYDRSTADKMIFQERHPEIPFTGRLLCGFDENNDGEIDKVTEYFAYFGAKAMAPIMRTHKPEDKDFQELTELLNNNEE